jgi:hypothetical protein
LAVEPFRTGERGIVTSRGVLRADRGAVPDPVPILCVVALEDMLLMQHGILGSRRVTTPARRWQAGAYRWSGTGRFGEVLDGHELVELTVLVVEIDGAPDINQAVLVGQSAMLACCSSRVDRNALRATNRLFDVSDLVNLLIEAESKEAA